MTNTIVERRDCAGGCGREIPRYLHACAECMKALPDSLRERLTSEYEQTRTLARAEAALKWRTIRGEL